MFTLECINLPLERKEEIKNIAIEMKNSLNNYLIYNPFCFKNPKFFIDKAYSFYKQKYGDTLNKEEKCIFNLYILFPNDDVFDELVEQYNKNFDQIGLLFNVYGSIAKLRYLLQKNIKAEKAYENEKTYKKQQN